MRKIRELGDQFKKTRERVFQKQLQIAGLRTLEDEEIKQLEKEQEFISREELASVEVDWDNYRRDILYLLYLLDKATREAGEVINRVVASRKVEAPSRDLLKLLDKIEKHVETSREMLKRIEKVEEKRKGG